MKKTARTRLIEERKRRQWSQQELADQIGTTRINVSRWEAGLTTPGPYFRTKLSELFGISVHELGLLDRNSSSNERDAEAGEKTGEPQGLWTVPYLRNPHFTGREELLDRLDQQFATSRNDHPTPLCQVALTQSQAIKGLGGIGKTQIAVEYAYQSREQGRYTHILWINAASEEAMMTSFVALAEVIPAIAAAKETDQHKLVAAIIRWLEQCKKRWLLIFDNADEVALLEPYLPHQGKGSLLFTTRAHAVGAFAASIYVEKMGLVEGTLLLLHRAQREHASDEARNEASNIVIALDGFPLALDQAGAYIEETGCSFRDYLQTYQECHQKLLARRGRQVTNYPDSVATTWSLSFTQIERSNPAAVELLHLCAFLAPDAIPEELLTEGAAQWPALLQQAVNDHFAFNHLLESLLSFSLIKRRADERVLSLHRLVQVVQRDTMVQEEQRAWAERAVRAVHGVFPRDPKEDVASWPDCLRYLEQVQACDALIRQYQILLPEAAELLNRTGAYLCECALYTQAEPLSQQSLHIWERLTGPEHSQVASPLYTLAELYHHRGKYAEAEPLYQRARSIWEQQLGPEDCQVATVLNNLAVLYYNQGKYQQAETAWGRALRIWEQTRGPDHLDTLSSLNGLAILSADQGRYEQAELLFLRILHIREQAFGSDHLQITNALHNLATLYTNQGKYKQAEPICRRALHIREQALGSDHPDVTLDLNGLADLYREQGVYEQAQLLYERALYISEQALGPEHPHVISSLNGLANLYCKQHQYEKAKALFRRALHIGEQHLGLKHPKVATLLNGLANLYREQGEYGKAELLYQRALSIREQALGEQHLETAETLHDFAVCQEAQGKREEAMSLYQRALSTREQILGAEHPTTIATRTRYLACAERVPPELP